MERIVESVDRRAGEVGRVGGRRRRRRISRVGILEVEDGEE